MTRKRNSTSSHSPLQRRLFLFWLPIFGIMLGIAYWSQAHYDPEKEAKSGLQRLNQWRNQAGLTPLQVSPLLQTAARKHALYLTKDAHGHDEINHSNPYFTGESPQDRATAAGYSAPIAENLTIGNFARSGRRSVDGLMTALYHRLSMLNPDHDEAGAAWTRGRNSAFVVKQGSSYDRDLCDRLPNKSGARYILTTYCNGQKTELGLNELPPSYVGAVKFPIGRNIEPEYDGNEQPNPMPNHGATGNPISIAFFGEKDDIQLISFKLFSPTGEISQTHTLTASNDPNNQLSKTEFALFPLEKLDFETKYRAEFRYRQNNQDKVETWEFTTRKKRHFLEF